MPKIIKRESIKTVERIKAEPKIKELEKIKQPTPKNKNEDIKPTITSQRIKPDTYNINPKTDRTKPVTDNTKPKTYKLKIKKSAI
jgi:hypothetical protein